MNHEWICKYRLGDGARDGGASRPADETAGTAAPPGITCMTFDKVRQYNAYTSMIENHSRFHHATHGRHEHMRMGPWRTRKKGHQKAVRPQLFEGDPGPWDGTAHAESILDRKLHVAVDQANMQEKYAPLSQFQHRDEVPENWIDKEKPFSSIFHVDNCLTLQLKAAKNMAGLMSSKDPPEDPHMIALMEKRKRLGRHIWVKALPSTGTKWANQVARMEAAVDQEDFSTDGRLEGGPCEYDHRSLKKCGVPFQTNFHLPSSGTGCLNINGNKTKLLVETETEFTEAAKARLWAQAKLVNEEARVHEMKKRIRRMRAPVEDDVEMHFGDKMTEDNTRFRGSTRQSYGSAGSRGRMSRSSTRSMPMRTRQSNWSEAGGKKIANSAVDRGYSTRSRDVRSRNTSSGYRIRMSNSRPESRNTIISRPVSRMTTASRTGSRVVASAKQDMKHLAMRDAMS